MITKHDVDLVQGRDRLGREFGYVRGDEEGGFFFTWMETLEASVASVEEDSAGGAGGLDATDVEEFLREYLPTTKKGRRMWNPDEPEDNPYAC